DPDHTLVDTEARSHDLDPRVGGDDRVERRVGLCDAERLRIGRRTVAAHLRPGRAAAAAAPPTSATWCPALLLTSRALRRSDGDYEADGEDDGTKQRSFHRTLAPITGVSADERAAAVVIGKSPANRWSRVRNHTTRLRRLRERSGREKEPERSHSPSLVGC